MAEKILIVDDDVETRRLVGLMLHRQGYQTAAAGSGKEALDLTRSEKPDLILLDIMMPDIDGYEVTRQIRSDPAIADTPIIMFSAKSQVDEKVAGFDAGADDYLTKPTHPAELTAHVKALLARSSKARSAAAIAGQRAYVVGVLGAKGGLGVSTLALNVGVSLFQKYKTDVIVAEFRPGYGSLGPSLGYSNPDSMKRLIGCELPEISPGLLEKELVPNASGVRLLLSSTHPRDVASVTCTAHYEAILNRLAQMCSVLIVDFGTLTFPEPDNLLSMCNEAIVVVEPNPVTVTRTKVLLEDLTARGFGMTRLLTVTLVNRIRADIQLTWSQVQETLGVPIVSVITPAPELSYQSEIRYTPMVMIQPDGLLAQQYGKLADVIVQHNRK